MPEKKVRERARADARAGKAPSTQAGEFVREEIEHVRQGKHGARSTKQAIAIGLSKARRAGVAAKPGKTASAATRRKAEQDLERGKKSPSRKPSPRRSRAARGALQREGHAAASREALEKQGRQAARRRAPADRSAAAKKAARTKTPAARKTAARKAATTRKAATHRAPAHRRRAAAASG